MTSAAPPAGPAPKTRFISFYSYKGGVGRTLALANCARALAQMGKTVAILDLDLEAPGLAHFSAFRPKSEKAPGEGRPWPELAGFAEYIADCRRDGPPERLSDYFHLCTGKPGDGRGRVYLMPAGKRDGTAYRDILSFDWDRFYAEEDGYRIMENLRGHIAHNLGNNKRNPIRPDYVLIDARTGLSETGGIATHQLADLVVMLFGLNRQNLEGTAWVHDSLAALPDPPKMLLVVSPLPDLSETGKGTLFADRLDFIRERLSKAVNHKLPATLPYRAALFYEERIVVEGDEADLLGYDKPYLELLTSIRESLDDRAPGSIDLARLPETQASAAERVRSVGDSAHSPVRILHLSDFHFRADRAWDSDPVLRGLARYIADEVRHSLAPDLVAITGDLAFSGKAEEYALAREWLEGQLWPSLTPAGAAPLPRDRLLLVPGNHDVDRNAVDEMAQAVQSALLSKCDQDLIAKILDSARERTVLTKRHAAYRAFHARWLGPGSKAAKALSWWHRTIEIRGQRLHVAGLDSAWMACRDADRGHLLLGLYQLHQSVLHKDGEGADWRLAMLHHPWDYLAEFDTHDSRQTVHLHRDLLLRGHLHEGEASFVRPPDPARACLELAAGCVYDGSRHPNAFQWIEIYPDPRRVRVLFRAWVKGKWQIDRNQPGCPDGQADFAFETVADAGKRPAAPQAPTVPPDYLAWLRRAYGGVDLLGQDAQQGQSVTLSQVYVPAVTTPAAPPDPGRQPVDRQEQPPPTLLLQRIDETSLYCPAPPGAGKSTFCRWAALQSIPVSAPAHPVPAPEGFAEPAPADLRTRLPLLVPLREFWQTMDCGQGRRTWCRTELEQALADWIDRAPPDGLTGGLLKAHLARGSAFLLLDGLDDVPVGAIRDGATVYPRALLLAGLADALPVWERAGNRILLTSRPYGLDEAGLARLGLPRAPLEPLPKPLQNLFVTRWFHALDKSDLAPGLIGTVQGCGDLAPLAENPLLLTALCIIYGSGRRLPEDRYPLYHRICDNVLFNRYPGDARQREPVKARLEAIAYGMHTGAGMEEDRKVPSAEASDSEIERLLRAFAQLEPAYEQGRVEPAVQREELLTRSGLLLPRPGGRAAFYHLSFQEFLAAERIARNSEDRTALERVFRERGPVPEWRATLLFLFAAGVFNYRGAQWGLDLLARLAADLNRAGVKSNPAPAVLIAECLDLCLAKGYAVPQALSDGFRRTCLNAISDEIAIPARQTLGLSLGRLGDPRIASLRDPAAYVEVPAGEYRNGEGKERIRIETPFLLARYPTTNSQYRVFMEDGGYTMRDLWSEAGWDWLQVARTTEPLLWRDRAWNVPNQPVVGVTYWEAEACCRWAGGRLPTEQEWESAARGPEGCEYPWCGPLEDGICNSDEAGLARTSAVGIFPRSRQARLGLQDLAGNVEEWCDSFVCDDQRDAGSPRVLRGGCFYSPSETLRSSKRASREPEHRFAGIGFRCVLAGPRQP